MRQNLTAENNDQSDVETSVSQPQISETRKSKSLGPRGNQTKQKTNYASKYILQCAIQLQRGMGNQDREKTSNEKSSIYLADCFYPCRHLRISPIHKPAQVSRASHLTEFRDTFSLSVGQSQGGSGAGLSPAPRPPAAPRLPTRPGSPLRQNPAGISSAKRSRGAAAQGQSPLGLPSRPQPPTERSSTAGADGQRPGAARRGAAGRKDGKRRCLHFP